MRIILAFTILFHLPVMAFDTGFLKKYCVECHNNKKHKGGINFENFSNKDLLESIDQLYTGDMPPKKAKKHPSKLETQHFIKSVKASLKMKVSVLTYRWMMKSEYENTMSGFFGIPVSTELPERMKNEFLMPDSQMDENLVSGEYLDRVLANNKKVLDLLYPEKNQLNRTWGLKTSDDLAPYPKSENEVYKGGSALIKSSSVYLKWRAPLSGEYEVSLYAEAKGDKEQSLSVQACSYRIRSVNSKPKGSGKETSHTVASKPTAVKTKVFLRKDQLVWFYLSDGVPEYEKSAKPVSKGVLISGVKIKGLSKFDYRPWNKLFKAPKDKVRENLELWTSLLHSTASPVEEYLEVYEAEFANSKNADLAYKRALGAILSSYKFLIVDDYSADKKTLAHRLHRSLTGTLPAQKFIENFELKTDSLNLLKDTHYFSRALSNSWWTVDNIKFIDFGMYGMVRSPAKGAIIDSFYEFINHCIQKNLPIRSLIKNQVILSNSTLSQYHTDIPKPHDKKAGGECSPVTAPPGRQFGILSHPAVHAAISNGDKRPNPIVRAAWIYRQVLGQIPPEPPKDVPNIDPNVDGLTDIRDIVEKHKEDPSCYSCHQKFDGLGFMLEPYDSLGVYKPHETGYEFVRKVKSSERRELNKSLDKSIHIIKKDGLYKKIAAKKKDTHGEFYGGKLEDVKSFSDYLCGKGYKTFKTNVISRFSEQLLCRSLTAKEQLEIRDNLDNYSDNLKDLLNQLILSPLFTGNKGSR